MGTVNNTKGDKMIYQKVSFEDFRDAFRKYDRLNNFSYDGAQILFDYLEQGEDWGLDVIALCCEFTEMTEQEVREYYAIEYDESVEEYLQDNSIVCGSYINENSETVFVFQQF